MSAKHTPSPWVVNPKHAQVDAFNGKSSLPVCQLLWPTRERSEDETEANARLIAAAPDLLAALKVLLNATMYKNHPAESDMAIAAIAKAEGKS